MTCLISFKKHCCVLELYKLTNGWYEYNSEGRLSYKINLKKYKKNYLKKIIFLTRTLFNYKYKNK